MPSEDIYSDLWGEVLYTDESRLRVYLYKNKGLNNPTLVLENETEIKALISFLTRMLKRKIN